MVPLGFHLGMQMALGAWMGHFLIGLTGAIDGIDDGGSTGIPKSGLDWFWAVKGFVSLIGICVFDSGESVVGIPNRFAVQFVVDGRRCDWIGPVV